MGITKFERLVQINEELVRIAGITSVIANSSASISDKDKQIAPHMKKQAELLKESIQLFP
ncbi:hypothetical protein A8A01_03175 [Ewingella americana]|nr:hypothetical protein A8A01_03175 [Ewingella americana]